MLTGCATHAPMSEMVMFNKRPADEGEHIRFALSATYIESGVNVEEFSEKQRDTDFQEEGFLLEGNSIVFSSTWMKKDDFSYSFAFGDALGIDVTRKLWDDYYVSSVLSAPGSLKFIFQRRILDRKGGGISPGLFIAVNKKKYFSRCEDYCGNFFPDQSIFLFNTGLRSRFLLREITKPGVALTGSLDAGYIFEIGKPFIGFNISLTAF